MRHASRSQGKQQASHSRGGTARGGGGGVGQGQGQGQLHLAEVVEDSHALHLLHLPVQAAQGDARPKPLEGLMEKTNLLAS